MSDAAHKHAPETITVSRDVEAIQVPYGSPVTLREGTPVFMVQVLGGMFTVRTQHGFLVRVDGKDADALGQEVPKEVLGPDLSQTGGELREQTIWEQLKTCYDPEIPVNIVDLGLIYSCKISPTGPGQNRVDVQMTLTAPGCGMGQVLADDVQAKLMGIPGVAEAHVDLTFNPPWDPTRMSEEARLELGMM